MESTSNEDIRSTMLVHRCRERRQFRWQGSWDSPAIVGVRDDLRTRLKEGKRPRSPNQRDTQCPKSAIVKKLQERTVVLAAVEAWAPERSATYNAEASFVLPEKRRTGPVIYWSAVRVLYSESASILLLFLLLSSFHRQTVLRATCDFVAAFHFPILNRRTSFFFL